MAWTEAICLVRSAEVPRARDPPRSSDLITKRFAPTPRAGPAPKTTRKEQSPTPSPDIIPFLPCCFLIQPAARAQASILAAGPRRIFSGQNAWSALGAYYNPTSLRRSRRVPPEASLRGYSLGLLLVPLSIAASLSTPYLTGEAVAILQSPGGSAKDLYPILAWILILSVVGGLSLFAVRYLVIGASRKMEFDLRNRVFRHLQSLDQKFFHENQTGDLMAVTGMAKAGARSRGPSSCTCPHGPPSRVAIPSCLGELLLTLCFRARSPPHLELRNVGRGPQAVAMSQESSRS